MKTFKQYRLDEQQLLQEKELKEYADEAAKFLRALAISLGITVSELTKSIAKTVVKNPKSSAVASPFVAASLLNPGLMFTAAKDAFRTVMTPIVATLSGKGTAEAAAIADGIGIGALSFGALNVIVYGQKIGTKINTALMKRPLYKRISFTKKADKKNALDFLRIAKK